ncbi:MAG: Lipase precursor [Labilithrix sp.]|nr:Lipase precursor [Labilithrix sp.]
MRVIVAAALGLLPLLAASACSTREDTCAELRSDLKRCGLSATSLDCSRVDQSALESMVSRFADDGCDGAGQGQSDAVDPRLCKAAGWECPEPPTPEPGSARPAFPLVFVSGIDESAVFDWNPRIVASLNASFGPGTAFHAKVKGWSTTPERAADLWASLEELHARTGTKLNLVCYAVGGLDCRYLASKSGLFEGDSKGYAGVLDTVASITTIATPHRGTRVADAALAALESGTAQDLLGALAGSSEASVLPNGGALQRTLLGLTMDASLPFNAKIGDADGIVYQSFAGVSHILARSSASSEVSILEHCAGPDGDLRLLRHEGGNDAMNELLWVTAPWSSTSRGDDGAVVASPSDGMVSVASAKWGEFRGCIPADHYDVIGQIGHTTRDGQSGFDAPRFYRWVASDLAAKGL